MARVFDDLLEQIRLAHSTCDALADFASFADDLDPIALTPNHIPAADALYNETWNEQSKFSDFRDAPRAAGERALWRTTYEGSKIDQDFLDRFACYCVIGEGGAWKSQEMSSYIVYMPPHLDYPFHHHPAEELYVVLEGKAVFEMDGQPGRQVGVGDTIFHPSNAPHATHTAEKSLLAYVVWRNRLNVKPVWTDQALR